jgi:hypothetical protein
MEPQLYDDIFKYSESGDYPKLNLARGMTRLSYDVQLLYHPKFFREILWFYPRYVRRRRRRRRRRRDFMSSLCRPYF